MGQGRRRRGPALASAGPRPVRRASLRLRWSRPAALGPRGCAWLAPVCKGVWAAEVDSAPAAGVGGPPRPGMCWRPALAGRGRRRSVSGGQAAGVGGPPRPGMCWRPALAGRGRRRSVSGGQGPPQPGTRWRPALTGRGRQHAGCGGRGTTTARHPRAPSSGPPRSTRRRPRGSGDCHSPARAGAPDRARRGRAPARRGTPLCPVEKGGEVKNVACHLSRNNA